MGGGAVEVASYAAPAGEGGEGVPVAGDGLVPLCGLGPRSETLFVQSTAKSRVNRRPAPCSRAARSRGRSRVIAVVPVPEPVVDDPGGNGLVVAFPQACEDLRVKGGVAAGAGCPPPPCARRAGP